MTAPERPDPAQQRILLDTALAAIRYGLERHGIMPVHLDHYTGLLLEPRASFVTLKSNGNLRGCIGTLIARQPLIQDVATNAYRSAFQDPRFAPLQQDELEALYIGISILSPPVAMQAVSQQDMIDQLQPGRDGLIIQDGAHRATFLPSVWQHLPDPVEFLEHLKIKAGLPADYWSTGLGIERYGSFEFGDAVSRLNSTR